MRAKDDIKIIVAIIDSGIDSNKIILRDCVKLKIGYTINSKGKIVEEENPCEKHEHGTAIAMIIKNLCKDVEFININILDENLISDGRILIHSLKKAIEYKPDIIHLSLGTSKYRYKFALNSIVKFAEKKGIIIVSALNNYKTISYPAYIKNVIRVAGRNFDNIEDFYYSGNTFYAPDSIALIEGRDELINKKMKGNSMAAAYITGHLCMLKYYNINQEPKNLKKLLKEIGEQNYKKI